MLAKAAIPGEVLWPLLLGSALTLIAQWAGLGYQTRRQREARRADFQRTTLLQLRDLLGEVEEAVGRAMAVRQRLSAEFELSGQHPDEWNAMLSTSRPEMETLRSLSYGFVSSRLAWSMSRSRSPSAKSLSGRGSLR